MIGELTIGELTIGELTIGAETIGADATAPPQHGAATGAGAETAGDERVRPNGHVYKYDYANTAAGAAFESSGRTLEEEQRALREQSNEVRFKAAGRTFCSPSPRFSPHAW